MIDLSWLSSATLEIVQEAIIADKRKVLLSAIGLALTRSQIEYLELCNEYLTAAEYTLQNRRAK